MPLRKHVGELVPRQSEPQWLSLEHIAEVHVSSEDPEAPLEGALLDGRVGGWRAGTPGEQSLRICFDQPRDIAVIHLTFDETARDRVQEFELQWSGDRGETILPVVRQQFSFSAGATREIENYEVNLRAVTDLYLHIIPDISRGPQIATLSRLRVR